VSWSSYFGEFSPSCAELTDAVNFGLPDSITVENLRRKATRLRKKADEVDYAAKLEKLDQVASMRAIHPIAVIATPAKSLQ
jgi:hypothetical protein